MVLVHFTHVLHLYIYITCVIPVPRVLCLYHECYTYFTWVIPVSRVLYLCHVYYIYITGVKPCVCYQHTERFQDSLNPQCCPHKQNPVHHIRGSCLRTVPPIEIVYVAVVTSNFHINYKYPLIIIATDYIALCGHALQLIIK